MIVRVALTSLVILLMFLEFFGTSEASLTPVSHGHASIHSQESPSSFLAAFLFEKTEEETGRVIEEGDRTAGFVVVDFSNLVFSLSSHHTLQQHFVLPTFRYAARYPLREFCCVLQI